MEWFPDWSMWLILGFLLCILEIIISGVFIIWWGGAAIVVAITVALYPISLSWQLSIFAILAIIFSLIWWKYQHSKDIRDDENSTLNAREHYMLGVQGAIVELLENGIARGKFGDTTWRVIGENLQVGDSVQVNKVDGITLFVHKL
ncbi:NfeD family protein [Ursidibacter arcticus]